MDTSSSSPAPRRRPSGTRVSRSANTQTNSSQPAARRPQRSASGSTATRTSRGAALPRPPRRPANGGPATAGKPKPKPKGGRPQAGRGGPGGRKKQGGGPRGRAGTTRSRNSSQTFRKIQKLKTNTSYSQDLSQNLQKAIDSVPPLAKGDLRIVPVCGVEWITTNMTYVEMDGEIILVDAGLGFATEEQPGVGYTIPSTAYLQSRKDDIKALVITHGHLDHVGAIPYIIEDLGFPPIYTRDFGALFIKKKLEEFPQIRDKVTIHMIDAETGYTQLSDNFKVKFFGLTHSIPDSTGVVIQTPYGGIVSTGDVRVESDNGNVYQSEIDQYAFFKDEDILLMTIDSTGIEKPGWTVGEDVVIRNLDALIKGAAGRLFIGTFSSQVERMMAIMESAKRHNKYIVLEGRSIKSNLAIAEQLELTDFSHVVPVSDIENYPPDKVVVLITGSQGEEFASLNRVANGSHKDLKFRTSDTIVLSSSIIPSNHYSIAQLKNSLFRGSYNIITYTDNIVHASGHGTREELKWIHTQVPYKFLMPIHGEPYMTRMHADMANKELGVPKENIVVPDNGSIIEIRNNGTELIKLEEKIPSPITVVDGSYVGPLHKVLMDDRKALSQDGMFVIVVSLDVKSGKLKKSPDIISRGFVYLRDSKDMLNKVRNLAKRTVEEYMKKKKHADFDEIKDLLADSVTKVLIQETLKEPLVIPVVLGV